MLLVSPIVFHDRGRRIISSTRARRSRSSTWTGSSGLRAQPKPAAQHAIRGVQQAVGQEAQGVQPATGQEAQHSCGHAAQRIQLAAGQGAQGIQPWVGHAVQGVQPTAGQEALQAAGQAE